MPTPAIVLSACLAPVLFTGCGAGAAPVAETASAPPAAEHASRVARAVASRAVHDATPPSRLHVTPAEYRHGEWLLRPPGDERPHVSAVTATQAALHELPTAVRRDRSPVQVVLRGVTLRDYGKVAPDGTVEPTIEDRLAWVVLVPGTLISASGGPLTTSKPQRQTDLTGRGTLVHLVDANAGTWLLARTF
jgi:hypothetical protein